MPYRIEIDGLRALAVVAVILYHADFPFCGGGYVGVDVFFVISGYLITSLLISQHRSGSFSLAHFYERRARRILPALYTVMAVACGLGWIWLTPAEMQRFAQSVLAVTGFASNVLFWTESGYFDTAAALKPLLHTWSLAVEEQFYLLLPLVLGLGLRAGRRVAAMILVALAGLSFAAIFQPQLGAPEAAFFLLPARAWELLLGSLLALHDGARAMEPVGGLRRVVSDVAAGLGLAAIGYAVVAFDAQTPHPGLPTLVPTLGTALVLAWARPGTWTQRLLQLRPLVAIGLGSYSAYLWHHVLFVFARLQSLEEPSPIVYSGLIVLVGGLSYLSWRFVETPFRAPERVTRGRLLVSVLLASAAFVGFGWFGNQTLGFAEQRTTEAQRRVLETTRTQRLDEVIQCSADGTSYLYTRADGSTPTVTWAAFGDSHIGAYANALAEALLPRGEGVRQWGCNSCPPAFGLPSHEPRCWNWTQAAAARVVNDPTIRNVLVTYRLTEWGRESNPVVLDELWSAYVNVVNAFVAAGKRVFVVVQAPELPVHIDELIFRHRLSPEHIVGTKRDQWETTIDPHRRRLQSLPQEVTLVDPAKVLCDAQWCDAVRGGVALYFDNNHLSTRGADVVVRSILR